MKEIIINSNGLMFLIKYNDSGHYHIKSAKAGEQLKKWQPIKAPALQMVTGLSGKEIRGFFK